MEEGVQGSESKEVMDMNADFPPLSTSVMSSQHHRQLEPPVITAPMEDERTNQVEDESVVNDTMLQQMQPHLSIEVGSSAAAPPEGVTTVEGGCSPSENSLTLAGSEKLPFVMSSNSKEEEDEDEDEGDGEGVRGSRSAALLPDNEEGVASSLAVGTRSLKVAKPVTATSQQV